MRRVDEGAVFLRVDGYVALAFLPVSPELKDSATPVAVTADEFAIRWDYMQEPVIVDLNLRMIT